MAFQPVAATALVELIYLCAGQRCENTLYFRHSATDWVTSELTALGTSISSWWANEMAALVSTEVSLVQIDITALATQFSPKVVQPLSPVITGELGSSVLPNNATFCTTFTTALRGRAFRGRNYFVGLAESVVSGSTVGSTHAQDIRNAYNTLLGGSSYLDEDTHWVVVSRVVNNVVQMPTALTNFVVSTTHADLTVDSQRRRLPGRGT
jgi:hypothetical protein